MTGMAERVLMYHPDLPHEKPVSVTARAFDKAWSRKGWKQATEDLSKLSKDELVAAAERAGVDTSGTKAESAARLETQET
jgi:hypothetical protein